MEREMFYGASADLFAKAKWLRENMTEAENLLWKRLKENQMGYRFKPQHPVDIFIVDFYCHQLKLIIEVDGEIHNIQKEKDKGRTKELNFYKLKVIRFTNSEVYEEIEKVIGKIKMVIDEIQSTNHYTK